MTSIPANLTADKSMKIKFFSKKIYCISSCNVVNIANMQNPKWLHMHFNTNPSLDLQNLQSYLIQHANLLLPFSSPIFTIYKIGIICLHGCTVLRFLKKVCCMIQAYFAILILSFAYRITTLIQ